MKHITRRRPDSHVRLGTWRALILHRAASGAVSGNPLHRDLTRQGHRIFASTVHATLLAMERNGMISRGNAADEVGRQHEFRITTKGREHLDALRQELTAAYDEVVRGRGPERSAPSRAAARVVPVGLAGVDIVAAVQASEQERAKLQSALERIRAVIAEALS